MHYQSTIPSFYPTIAIVGRPNVGKSTLFNALCRQRRSITSEQVGVTRDCLYGYATIDNQSIRLVDTGGIAYSDSTRFSNQISQQAHAAMKESDGIILVVDQQIGVTEEDQRLAKELLQLNRPLILAINKCDNQEREDGCYPFLALGIDSFLPVCAKQNKQTETLLSSLLALLSPSKAASKPPSSLIRIACIGRPNVGKSSLFNAVMQRHCSIVAPYAGTTRDPVESHIEYQGQHYAFIDTAGLCKQSKEHQWIDLLAHSKTKTIISNSDLCLLISDASAGLTTEEKQVATFIQKQGKSCIWIWNKWDLVKAERTEHYFQKLCQQNPFLRNAFSLFTSAKTGWHVDSVLSFVAQAYAESNRRIPTAQLNQFVANVLDNYPLPKLGRKQLKIYYMTQVKTAPPTFLCFVNDRSLVEKRCERYLLNQIQKTFSLESTSIALSIRGKPQKTTGKK